MTLWDEALATAIGQWLKDNIARLLLECPTSIHPSTLVQIVSESWYACSTAAEMIAHSFSSSTTRNCISISSAPTSRDSRDSCTLVQRLFFFFTKNIPSCAINVKKKSIFYDLSLFYILLWKKGALRALRVCLLLLVSGALTWRQLLYDTFIQTLPPLSRHFIIARAANSFFYPYCAMTM